MTSVFACAFFKAEASPTVVHKSRCRLVQIGACARGGSLTGSQAAVMGPEGSLWRFCPCVVERWHHAATASHSPSQGLTTLLKGLVSSKATRNARKLLIKGFAKKACEHSSGREFAYFVLPKSPLAWPSLRSPPLMF